MLLFTASIVTVDPPSVRPLIELELREKKESVSCDGTKPMVSIFKSGARLLTSDVESVT